MNQYWLIGVAAAALVLAVVCLIAIARVQSALKAQTSNARWLQARMERIENEQGSIESALAGLGRHMDDFDKKLVQQAKQMEHVQTRFESVTASDSTERGFEHALRLSAQGRVTLQELVDDFGLSESEAQLLLRINQPNAGTRAG
ncbi:MAG: hypothetical protein B7X35_01280 [Halothiobacillus sp. 14-56-357]|jgi:septal ring factor EnvC (AmiA/AmiB activator)|uniref:DUF2802 domain-containing protein n=1 Tax=Halothiobacillus sp. 15-55-196 TaxID=1970382 RepID=UPI000BDCFDFA|nr:DUF2802 domain-containing protein [Halothiobacillus sp. 15-55-196]OZB37773.1 MAG: hypothetical protein B7X44_00265 [Halothiobacillus sp. 15-55-196]OZB57416.1 MAG: hypothetical protein B7X35_01280 [Halothiobacillus sp. 14-56-357]OZB78255.1 MAG: hypothetical protein B7X29_05620 [Halothiobacillus sp. 13-55-115]